MSKLEELLDSLEQAGITRDRVCHSNVISSCLVERQDLDRELVFEEEMYFFERGPRFLWRWSLWEHRSSEHDVRRDCVDSGHEKDLEGMVAKVVEFLGETP